MSEIIWKVLEQGKVIGVGVNIICMFVERKKIESYF